MFGARWRPVVRGGAAALALLPVLATDAVGGAARDPGDYVFLAVLLAGTLAACELAVRVPNPAAYRTAAGLALAAAILLAWINLAVGVVGSEDDPANLVYAGVLAVAAAGAAAARLRPRGMARAMVAAAAAQVAAFLAALVAGLGFTGPITVFFAAMWLSSAWLFRRAAQERSPASATPER